MLVDLTTMLGQAEQGGYAVVAPDFANLLTVSALLETAEELRAPLLLSWAPGLRPAMDVPDLARFMSMVRTEAEIAKIPVGLHLDHATNLEQIQEAIDAGFTSVMMDASQAPWDVNVERTRQTVEMARAAGIAVEAELGHVSTGGQYIDDQSPDSHTVFTDPDRAAEFVEVTGIDALAVSIGTIHGTYQAEPNLQFDLLARLHDDVSVPLVLHGASGTGASNIQRVVANGIRKINVYSDILNSLRRELASAMQDAAASPMDIADAQRRGIRQALTQWLTMSGSAGQA